MAEFEFPNIYSDRTLRIVGSRHGPEGNVYVSLHGKDGQKITAAMAREKAAEIAQAVLDAAALDAVILTDLPQVRVFPTSGGYIEAGGRSCAVGNDPEEMWSEARDAAAVARHLEKTPPVDPRVERLAQMLADLDGPRPVDAADRDDARRLIEAGLRLPEDQS